MKGIDGLVFALAYDRVKPSVPMTNSRKSSAVDTLILIQSIAVSDVLQPWGSPLFVGAALMDMLCPYSRLTRQISIRIGEAVEQAL